MHLRAIGQVIRLCHMSFNKRRLTCLGRGYDHASLALTDGRDQIGDPHGHTALIPRSSRMRWFGKIGVMSSKFARRDAS